MSRMRGRSIFRGSRRGVPERSAACVRPRRCPHAHAGTADGCAGAVSRSVPACSQERGLGGRRRVLPRASLHVGRSTPCGVEVEGPELPRCTPRPSRKRFPRREARGRARQGSAPHVGSRRRQRLVLVADGGTWSLRPRHRHLSRRRGRVGSAGPLRLAEVRAALSADAGACGDGRASPRGLPVRRRCRKRCFALRPKRAGERSRRLVGSCARGGIFLVLDSPVYDAHESGRAMVRRRENDHRERLGVLPTERTTGYLVASEFRSQLESAGFRVETRQPFEGLRRRLRRSYGAVRRLNRPARFPLFVAEKRA